LIEYAKTYEIGSGTNDGSAIGTMSVPGDHVRRMYTRKIETHHYLRPIPTGQLNALEMTDAEKNAYQNPGY
jgi:hypothetical protein